MKIYQSDQIKNIALVGGAKSGKTTLAEAMLFEGGSIKRRGNVDDKNTVSDFREIEFDKGNSVVSTVMHTEYGGKKINIIDTPGTASYVGEVIAALNVVDTALLVVDAHEGLNVGVELGWRNTSRLNVPTVFVINQLDHEKSKFEETLAQLQNAYGDKVTVAQYPVNQGTGFDTVIDLVYMKQIKYQKGGGDAVITDIPDSEKEKAEELDIKGSIKNNSDGSVSISAQATKEILQEFIAWLYTGSPLSRVDNIRYEESVYFTEYIDFEIIK